MKKRTRKEKPTVLINLSSHVQDKTIEGIISAADELDWGLLNSVFSGGQIPSFSNPQGAIVSHLPGDPEMDRLRSYGCKSVRMGRLPHPEDQTLPSVLPDYGAAGRMAAAHLAERGFENLGCISYINNQVSDALWAGFRDQARELGCSFSRLVLSGKRGTDSFRHELERAEELSWIESLPIPTGVFAFSDHRAGHFCNTCMSVGISVPEDIAIIGYGNFVQLCETASVAISTIDPNQEVMGQETARILDLIMRGQEVASATFIPPRAVIQRQSTDVLAVPNSTVAKALRFIWEHFPESITPADVAREVAVSRSGLDRLFRRYLSRTVNAEIGRKRLERCAELLRGTDLSVSDIAALTGFQTRTYLHKMFQRSYGMPPRHYRLQPK